MCADTRGHREVVSEGHPWQVASQCADGACVEVSMQEDRVLVRDSKVDGGPVLSYTREEWVMFLEGVKAGEFDVDGA